RAEDSLLSAVRSDESIRHVFATKVHVRHHPHELSILTEFKFTASLKVRCSCRNALLRIYEGFWSKCDVSMQRRFFRQSKADSGLIRSRCSVGRVMDLNPEVAAGANELGGIVKLEVGDRSAGHVHGFQDGKVFRRLREWRSERIYRQGNASTRRRRA